MQKRTTQWSPPWSGVIIYWLCCILVVLGFATPHPALAAICLLFIVPVFYGAHEALHNTLIPGRGRSKLYELHSDLALVIGFALQGMNFRLLRPAHLHHHAHGRDDEGYAPDSVPGKPTIRDYFRYYTYLLGLPALSWQIAGFAMLIVPARYMPFTTKIRFYQEKSKVPYFIAQLAATVFFVYAVLIGGWAKFLLFELFFCFMWSVLQNVSHYGLKGFDENTDRVCARSYILEEPFRILTFGSTSHLAHHVDMRIPGPLLHEPAIIDRIEKQIGLRIQVKYGIIEFLTDVAHQFKGPLPEERLDTSWIKEPLRTSSKEAEVRNWVQWEEQFDNA